MKSGRNQVKGEGYKAKGKTFKKNPVWDYSSVETSPLGQQGTKLQTIGG